MKRVLLTGLFLLGLGQMVSFAQNGTYKDDIYYKSSDVAADNDEEAQQQARNNDDSSYYYSEDGQNQDDGGYSTNHKSYNTDEYQDNDNDDYYATRINRFNYPFYNMGYYSSFYNPFWYDPFYSDSYGGWSYWNRPMMSFGFGPYWSSYWGYYSWYGYPAYYSYYNYPCYGGWYDGGYYSGYWNGYYAGIYGDNVHHRSISYGPRSSTNTAYNLGVRSNALRQTLRGAAGTGVLRTADLNNRNAVRSPERTGTLKPENRTATDRNPEDRPVRRYFSDQPQRTDDRGYIDNGGRQSSMGQDRQPADGQYSRGPRQMGQNTPANAQPRQQYSQPRQQTGREQPRSEPRYQQQRSEPSYQRSEPSYQRSEPRMQSAPRTESPRMSPSGGGSSPRGSGGRR